MQPSRIASCTTLGSLGLLSSNQLSRIKNSDSSTTPTVFPLGMHPKIWLHTVVTWQRPQTLNLKVIAEMNLTPVTIMVVDTIGAVKSRQLHPLQC